MNRFWFRMERFSAEVQLQSEQMMAWNANLEKRLDALRKAEPYLPRALRALKPQAAPPKLELVQETSRIPAGLIALAALCLLVLATIPISYYQGWLWFARPPNAPATHSGGNAVALPFLYLSAVQFDGPGEERAIIGTINNGSGQLFHDVQVTFEVHAADGAPLSAVRARIGSLPPGSALPFKTESVPPQTLTFVLRDIRATQ
jgi:hypothetical protein